MDRHAPGGYFEQVQSNTRSLPGVAGEIYALTAARSAARPVGSCASALLSEGWPLAGCVPTKTAGNGEVQFLPY